RREFAQQCRLCHGWPDLRPGPAVARHDASPAHARVAAHRPLLIADAKELSMMMTGIRRLTAGMLLATALGSVSLAAQSPGEPLYADVIFTGGKIVTVDSEERIVDSVAIRKNRIVAVGETGPWKGPATKIVDLQGRTMLP